MPPSPPAAAFYLDWTFWTAVVAGLALVLSQLPPLRVLFRRAALALQPYDRLNVTHYLGNPNVNLHVQLTNTGGRTVRVRSLTLEITRDDGATVTLPAQTFTGPDGTEAAMIFTPLALEPNDEWVSFVSFFVPFSATDEREWKRLAKELRADVNSKRTAYRLQVGEESKEALEADPARVAPLTVFFRAKRFWQPGEYSARLIATCKPTRASVTRQFRFTLFESDVQDLDEREARYKFGAGVYFNDTEEVAVNPRIRDLG
jgi:hypothetical protein